MQRAIAVLFVALLCGCAQEGPDVATSPSRTRPGQDLLVPPGDFSVTFVAPGEGEVAFALEPAKVDAYLIGSVVHSHPEGLVMAAGAWGPLGTGNAYRLHVDQAGDIVIVALSIPQESRLRVDWNATPIGDMEVGIAPASISYFDELYSTDQPASSRVITHHVSVSGSPTGTTGPVAARAQAIDISQRLETGGISLSRVLVGALAGGGAAAVSWQADGETHQSSWPVSAATGANLQAAAIRVSSTHLSVNLDGGLVSPRTSVWMVDVPISKFTSGLSFPPTISPSPIPDVRIPATR